MSDFSRGDVLFNYTKRSFLWQMKTRWGIFPSKSWYCRCPFLRCVPCFCNILTTLLTACSWLISMKMHLRQFLFPSRSQPLWSPCPSGLGRYQRFDRRLSWRERTRPCWLCNNTWIVGSLIVGICINILALLIMKPYFSAFTNNPAIFDYAMQYMSVCAFMQVPNMVHIAIQKVFQGTGNMITPMWFQIAGVIFNFVFDPLLIFGIGPFPKMGIRGAALATVFGYALSMVIAFLLLVLQNRKFVSRSKDSMLILIC